MAHTKQIPKEEGLDHSLDVLKEGYAYFLERRKKLDTDVFETTVLGQKAYCLGGEAGAELFYDTSKDVAAVELLNIIRPIVAISIYVAFTALALIQFPAAAETLSSQNPLSYQHFVQEVRHFYPFFSFQGA